MLRSGKNTCRAFFGQLLQALAQLLGLERVLQAHAAEQFRGEVRNTREAQRLAFGEGVADLDGAMVVQADDVAGIGFLELFTLGGEERQRIADAQVLPRRTWRIFMPFRTCPNRSA